MQSITEEQWNTIRSNMSDAIDHLNVLVGQAADAFAESVRVWHARGAGLPPLTVNNVKGSAGNPVIAMIKKENGYRVQAWNGVSVYDYDVGPDGRYPHNPRYSIDLAGLLSRAIVASLTPDPRAEKIEADADETRRLKGDVLTVREAAEAIRDQVLFTGPRDFDEYEYAVRMLLKAFEFETADEVTIDPGAPPTITAEPVAPTGETATPTMELRWRKDADGAFLEQAWTITTLLGGLVTTSRTEWREVPCVDETGGDQKR